MSTAAERRNTPRRPWFAIWAWFLTGVSVAAALTMIAATSVTLSHRPPPLPHIEAPKIEHDGIYPVAAQELTKPIVIHVAPRHNHNLVNALLTDIEAAGGRVIEHDSRQIEALAPSSYVQGLQALRDRGQPRSQRNPHYPEWVRRVADQEPEPATGQWTSFTVHISPAYMVDQTNANAFMAATIATVAGLITLALSFAAREDLRNEQTSR